MGKHGTADGTGSAKEVWALLPWRVGWPRLTAFEIIAASQQQNRETDESAFRSALLVRTQLAQATAAR
jgi:hypothetical protein